MVLGQQHKTRGRSVSPCFLRPDANSERLYVELKQPLQRQLGLTSEVGRIEPGHAGGERLDQSRQCDHMNT